MKIVINDSSILTALAMGGCSPEVSRDVITEVVHNLPRTSPEYQHAFGEHLRSHIKVSGFRDSHLALKNATGVRRVIAALSAAPPPVLVPVLRGWLELHADLAEAVQAFTETAPTMGVDQGIIDSLMSDGLEAEWLKARVREFQTQYPGFDDHAAAIMFCLSLTLTSDSEPEEPLPVPSSDDSPAVADGTWPRSLPGGRLQTLLSEVAQLPPHARIWGELEAFADALRALVESKRAELASSRSALSEALRRLREEASAAIEWFQWNDVTYWTAEDVGFERIADATAQINVLHEALLEHQMLLQQRAANRDAYARQQARREALEQEIENLHTDLGARLAPSIATTQPTVVPERDSAPVESEPVSDPGTSEATPSDGVPTDDTSSGTPEPSPDAIPEAEPDGESPETSPPDDEGTAPAKEMAESAPEDGELPVETTVAPAPGAGESQGEEQTPPQPTGDQPAADELLEVEGEPPVGVGLLPVEGMTSHHIAGLLAEDDCDDHWHLLLWALVDEDDLPGAYWLTRWLAATGRTPANVSPGLLAAAQGARWLSPSAEIFSLDLQEITRSEAPDIRKPEQGLIGLAAALRSALLAPLSGLASWLHIPDVLPSISELHALIPAIEQLAERAIALRSEDLEGVTGAEQRAEAIAAVVDEARRWLKDAPNRGHNTGRASSIWKHMVGPSGDLRALLQPITEDKRSDAASVRKHLSEWEDRGAVAQHIDDAFRNVVRATTRPLPTPMRQVLERNVAEAIDMAQRWCMLVERDRRYVERGDWMTDRIAELRDKAAHAMPPTYGVLADLSMTARELSTRAAARCLWRALVQLADTLHIPQPGAPVPPSRNLWAWLTEQSVDLPTAMTRRLLWLPELTLAKGVDEEPDSEEIAQIGIALRTACAEQRSWQQALDGWLDKQDYRFSSLLERALPESERARAASRCQEMLEGSRAALREMIVDTENCIERAVVDGILDDAGRAGHGDVVAKIAPEEILSFSAEYVKLEGIRTEIDLGRRQRMDVLGAEWSELSARLDSSSLDLDQRQAIRRKVEDALTVKDTRVVDEHLARLRSVLEGGGEAALVGHDGVKARDTLVDFLQQAQIIEQAMVERKVDLQKLARDIEKQRTILGFPYAHLPVRSIEESVVAVQQWNLLRQGQPHGQHVVRSVERLLVFLGFEVLPSGLLDEPFNRGTGWAHVRVRASASSDSARPIAQFGSRAPEYQDVICFWSRPIAETVSDSLQRLGITDQHALVFYLGRLAHHERTNLGRQFQARKVEVVVMDEVALLYLTRERDVRLRTLLRLALPYTAFNPYTPFQAGDVPPEMFFGREDMAKELQRREGSCLVYGGRQLGKSALLRHVQWRVHRPEEGQYAHVFNMKLVYDPAIGKQSENIWLEIRDRLRDARDGFLPTGIRSDNPDTIRRHLRDGLLEVPSRRVLLMFDEADQFLDAEAEKEFRNIRSLRELMLETKGQFKVVFAGLHNVQRFQNIPNQPLAHFGNPILVGPLEPDAAQRLVCEPLETLGYRFTDDTIVLRILSYTNYHPGLIQLFCQELLHDIRRHAASTQSPPYTIERSRVESVYLRVRDYVRERFELTLALDSRYQAIAWAMIVDQMETRDGFARPYSGGDVLKLVRGWWPAGFRRVDQQQMRGLLDEMIGLGVLARTSHGLYRLRSPNLVRLMGTEQDIGDRLLSLEQSATPVQPGADDYHALLDQRAGSYSPLTYDQESRAFAPRTGVTVVFACPAQGFSAIAPAFERLAPDESRAATAAFGSVSARVSDATDMHLWLDSFLKAHERHEKLLVCCQPLGLTGSQIRALVGTALEFCEHIEQRQRRTQQQWLRVLFVLDPANTWAWLSLPADVRQDLENRVYPDWPRPWTLAGIRHRLQQHQMVDLESVCQALLDVTGGWQMLLDQVFSNRGRQDDLRPVANDLQAHLTQPEHPGPKQFYRSLGLPNDLVRAVAAYVVREEESLRELLDGDCIPDVPNATPAECNRAVEFLLRLGSLRLRDGVLVPDPVVAMVLRTA